MRRLGIDVGGTFTDLVLVDEERGDVRVHRLPTTTDDSSRGTMAGAPELLAAASEARR